MKTIKIYILIDPNDGDIKYVGKTTQKLSYRLSAHMREKGKCHRVNWIKKLKEQNQKPRIMVIEEIDGGWPWQESERFWIKFFKKLGFNLTNNTSGGDGVPDLPKETRQKISAAWIGIKHSAATIEKLKTCRTNFRHTDESKAKISAGNRGKKIHYRDKIAEANRKITDQQASEILIRINMGEKICDLAKEYGIHRTTMSKIKKQTYFKMGQK
jgi:hypothetical protein